MKISKIGILLVFLEGSLILNAAALSQNPCGACHRDGRYMFLHISENPLRPLPTSAKIDSTYNITLNLENLCSEPENSVMTNVKVTLKSKNGNFQVDSPTRVIAALPVGVEVMSWKISVESTDFDVLEFEASATNPHNNLQLIDRLSHEFKILKGSEVLYNVKLIVIDLGNVPLTGAVVSFGLNKGITDSNGVVIFNLPPGAYPYNVTNVGFQPFSSSSTVNNDLDIMVRLNRVTGEEIGEVNLPFPFLESPWFVALLAVGLGLSGFGLGLMCKPGGKTKRSSFFLVSTLAISASFITILIYILGIRISSPLIDIFGINHSLTHWIGWIGLGYLLLFMTLSSVSKRKVQKLYPKLFRVHVIGNLLATLFVTFHFMQQITRPADNYPSLGTGVVLYLSVMGLSISGYGRAFGFFSTRIKEARFIHLSLTVTLLVVIVWHILHGIYNPLFG